MKLDRAHIGCGYTKPAEVVEVRPKRPIDVGTGHFCEVTRAPCAQHNCRYRVLSNLSVELERYVGPVNLSTSPAA
jgi:hypothetical protein